MKPLLQMQNVLTGLDPGSTSTRLPISTNLKSDSLLGNHSITLVLKHSEILHEINSFLFRCHLAYKIDLFKKMYFDKDNKVDIFVAYHFKRYILCFLNNFPRLLC